MEVYLDNAATTKVMDKAVEKTALVFGLNYGNSASMHKKGMEAEKEVIHSKKILAGILKIEPNELYFTSGGTESNNMAILGAARIYHRRGKHIIVSAYEHPSVLKTAMSLEEEGFEVSILKVQKDGSFLLEELEKLIREDTILVSIMHVNNEVGTIAPIEKIGKLIKKKNQNTLFHVDAVQSFGKLEIFPKKYLIDYMSVSGHKLYAPKGIGILYIKKGLRLKPLFYGGGHQEGVRPGTENTPAIAALGTVAEQLYANLSENYEKLGHIKKYLRDRILNEIENTYQNSPSDEITGNHILNIRFEDVKGEVLLHSLEEKGIYVSTGSACSSKKTELSSTLLALGYTSAQVDSSIRFSFSLDNTIEEMDYLVEQLKQIVATLRKFVKK